MNGTNEITLERGVLTISLDFELIWGTVDLFGPERFRRACELEREVIIDRLLALFVEYEIPATWCIVGHLFLDHCETADGVSHPDIIRPQHAWCRNDWFSHDPCSSEREDAIFYGRSLIERIRACPVPQEVGCHSFSHVIFGDAGCSSAVAESEIRKCVELAREMGLEMQSFAFPRNEVGHLDVLRKYGFRCYRGPEPHWYELRPLPRVVRRLAHLWDVITAAEPPVVLPEQVSDGFWNIPGSLIYFPKHGLRRYIPLSRRVSRAIRGLNAAARQKRIFHLWFHPTNLADEMERMFDGLRQILQSATELRQIEKLEFLPMNALVPGRGQNRLWPTQTILQDKEKELTKAL